MKGETAPIAKMQPRTKDWRILTQIGINFFKKNEHVRQEEDRLAKEKLRKLKTGEELEDEKFRKLKEKDKRRAEKLKAMKREFEIG